MRLYFSQQFNTTPLIHRQGAWFIYLYTYQNEILAVSNGGLRQSNSHNDQVTAIQTCGKHSQHFVIIKQSFLYKWSARIELLTEIEHLTGNFMYPSYYTLPLARSKNKMYLNCQILYRVNILNAIAEQIDFYEHRWLF